MPKVKTIHLVSLGDDWEGLYVNGVLVTEGHSISAYHVLDALGLNPQVLEVPNDDGEWGALPKNLKTLTVK